MYVLVKRGNYEVVKLIFTAIGLKQHGSNSILYLILQVYHNYSHLQLEEFWRKFWLLMDPLAGMCRSPQSTRIKTSKILSINNHISETVLFIEHSRLGKNLPWNEIIFLLNFSMKSKVYVYTCKYILNNSIHEWLQ